MALILTVAGVFSGGCDLIGAAASAPVTEEAEGGAPAPEDPQAAADFITITDESHSGSRFRIRLRPRSDKEGMKPREVVAESLRLIKAGKTEEAKEYWTIFYPEGRAHYGVRETYEDFCKRFQSYDRVTIYSLGRSKGHYTVWYKCWIGQEDVHGGTFSVDKEDGLWRIARWTNW